MPRYDPQRLRAARERAGMTQQAVADGIGRSSNTYVRYESGRVTPTVYVLGDVAGVLGVPVDDLFDPSDPSDPVTAFAAEIKAMVDAAPPLTAAQKSQLRVLLRNTA